MRLVLLIFFATFLFSACSNKPKVPADKNLAKRTEAFHQLLSEFKILKLPFRLERGYRHYGDEAEPVEINQNSDDTLFIQGMYFYLGLLPDTSDFYALICRAGADDLPPVIMTFTKSGTKISEADLWTGGGGADCGYFWTETVSINPGYSIFCDDSISIGECDSLGRTNPDSVQNYTEFKTGKIGRDGVITMSKLARQNLAKSPFE